MRSLSSLGIGLSLVFGCLLLALVAEVYYLMWWKKKLIVNNRDIEADCTSPVREFLHIFCMKKCSSVSSAPLKPQNTDSQETQLSNSNKDVIFRPFEDESLEAELMRLHNLAGPPRFLFTIKEETKEDLESEDGKSVQSKSRKGSKSRSLSDILLNLETPFLTPMSSPPLPTPPLTPINSYGLNPLFESSSTEAELSRIRSSSPPPKFKFLRDAEEKLYKRLLIEEAQKKMGLKSVGSVNNSSMVATDEDGSFITIYVSKNKEREHQFQHHTCSSQVLPLSSSPSTIKATDSKSIFHWNSKD
ncbi:hypothetical protein Syun_015914 [Stephania yunnanensis]|uniref:Uncharacterized protein n=1 Tax=Stephania yunnanensis TaxID=152371 RepID=A0AAP0P0V7_9MAGN